MVEDITWGHDDGYDKGRTHRRMERTQWQGKEGRG
jgi:hypothetical protein